jgi:hypothetical protein
MMGKRRNHMTKYAVEIEEVHAVLLQVEASSPEDAKNKVLNGEGVVVDRSDHPVQREIRNVTWYSGKGAAAGE